MRAVRLLRAASLLAPLLAVAAPAASRPASAAEIADFFGVYVGTARVEEGGRVVGRREIDVTIAPYKDDGFRVDWITVSLVDGRRDVPGVKRRVDSALFEPGDLPGVFVASRPYDPFSLRDDVEPMAGDPLRWAAFDGKDLDVYSLAVLPDGRFELQVYTRSLTEIGLTLDFRRVDDGAVVRRVTGGAARAESE